MRHTYQRRSSAASVRNWTFLVLVSLISSPAAAQSAQQYPLQAPSSESLLDSLPVPTRALEWGNLNILSTTDTHGWLRGHLHHKNIPEALYSASIADVAAFHEHLSHQADERGVDLLFVDSGDVVDGNGFVDADTSGVKGHAARQLLKQVGYDIVTPGNHELYNYTVAHDVYTDFIPSFSGHYLASNVNITVPFSSTAINSGRKGQDVPYGSRYLQLKTKNQAFNITAFGVLFNFERPDVGLDVQAPEEMVRETWWREAMDASAHADAFVLVGHMATRDRDWLVVLNAIRSKYPTIPVLIFAGHAHVRDCVRPDPYTQILASGRYMETVGFTSINLPHSSAKEARLNADHPLFTSVTAARAANPLNITRRYLDSNLATYHFHSHKDVDSFSTTTSRKIQAEMDAYAASFDLAYTYGNAPQSYYLNRYPVTHEKSLIKLYAEEVFNTVLTPRSGSSHNPRPAFLFNTGGARFDIFKGPFTRDDQFTVIPFENGLWTLDKPLEYGLIVALVEWLNNMPGEPELVSELYADIASASIDARIKAQAFGVNASWVQRNDIIMRDAMANTALRNAQADQYAMYVQEQMEATDTAAAAAAAEKLTFGYVTHDACGPDGDDVHHRPLPAYRIPEFVLSKRNADANESAVDQATHIVFYEFIAPLVLLALNNLQTKHVYTYANMAVYSNLKANELLGEYAKMAWT